MVTPPNRYQRQTVLPEIAEAGQCHLADSKILVVGLGGLGVPAATYLAGAGVGLLTLIDADTVALHNLHRQVIYTEADAGTAKVEVAARHLRQLNSSITIAAQQVWLSSANVATLVASHDIIIDAADNFASTYLLSDHCKQQHKPLVSASILGHRGYLGVFCGDAPSYRALFPNVAGDTADCNSAGVLGPAVGVLGLMQAQEAIKLIVAPEHALQGVLLTLDLWNMRFSSIDFGAATEPANAVYTHILERSSLTASDILVDVRSLAERQADPQPNSIHLETADPGYLKRSAVSGHRLVFFCQTGDRAKKAAEAWAQQQGQNQSWLWLR